MNKTVLIIIAAVILIPIVLYVLFWVFLGASFTLHDLSAKSRLPDPPQPEITYAEFPFKIELEHNGEQIIIEDTIICEYVGVKYISGVGTKVRKWRNKLASEKDFVDKEKIVTIFRGEVDNHTGNYWSINYRYGSADYYMGDMGEGSSFEPRIEIGMNPDFRQEFESNDEILEHYGVKIISIEKTPPIKNSFK